MFEKDSFPEDEEYMYLLGLFNSMGAVLLAGASKNQIDYITELSSQYTEHGENILDMFMHRNASTYLSLVASKRYGFDTPVCYDLVGWNGLSMVPEKNKKRVGILHLAETIDFYSRGMIDFYQIDKDALKMFNIVDERQYNKLVKDLSDGFDSL